MIILTLQIVHPFLVFDLVFQKQKHSCEEQNCHFKFSYEVTVFVKTYFKY